MKLPKPASTEYEKPPPSNIIKTKIKVNLDLSLLLPNCRTNKIPEIPKIIKKEITKIANDTLKGNKNRSN